MSTPPEPSGRSLVDALVERTARVPTRMHGARCRSPASPHAQDGVTGPARLFRPERCVSIIVEFRLYLSRKPSLVTDWCRPPRVPRRPPAGRYRPFRSEPARSVAAPRTTPRPSSMRETVFNSGLGTWRQVCRTAGCRLRLPWDVASWGLWGAEPCGWASVVVDGARRWRTSHLRAGNSAP